MINPLGPRPARPSHRLHADYAAAQKARQAWDVATTTMILDNYQDLTDRGDVSEFLLDYIGPLSECRESQAADPGYLGPWAGDVAVARPGEVERMDLIKLLFVAR